MLEKSKTYKVTLPIAGQQLGSEFYGPHWTCLISESEWADLLQTGAFVPVTSAIAKTGSIAGSYKTLFACAPVHSGVVGLTVESLLLPSNLDTTTNAELAASNAQYMGQMPASILGALSAKLDGLLLDAKLNRPIRYRIGSLLIAPGDILLMRDTVISESSHAAEVIETPWVVISSDPWLELLHLAYRHSNGMVGVVRGLLTMVPLFGTAPKPNELVAVIESPQPSLPDGGHARFHRVRARALQRVVSVVGEMDDEYLRDIVYAVRCFLGLRQ